MDFVEKEKNVYSQVFGRLKVCIEKGSGCFLWDDQGNKYLDLFSGIAVCSVGHCHPKVTQAITQQAIKLVHTSNWVYTKPQLELAEKILELTGLNKVFYTNTGGESVETAMKLSRKVTGKTEIISCEKSFHGRTLGALSLTWNEKYRKPFEPLIPRTKFTKFGDIEELKEAITKDTAAFIVEPIQGEAGVYEPEPGYLKAVREITKDEGVALIMDEVQTGFGRTGNWFAYQKEDILPDILCLAKGLGGGFPIGATVFGEGFDFDKGQHGGTFAGSPLACTTAKTVIEVIEKEKLLQNAIKQGKEIRGILIKKGFETRGVGLINAFEANGRETVEKLLKAHVLTINSNEAVRIIPALNICEEEINLFKQKIEEVF